MSQSVTKDERLAGKKLPICGNAKLLIGPRQDSPAPTPTPTPRPPEPPAPAPRNEFADDDSVPF